MARKINVSYRGQNEYFVQDDSPTARVTSVDYDGEGGWELAGELSVLGAQQGSHVLTVDQEGDGDFTSIAAACEHAASVRPPEDPVQGQFYIDEGTLAPTQAWWVVVKPGVYYEPPFTLPFGTYIIGTRGHFGQAEALSTKARAPRIIFKDNTSGFMLIMEGDTGISDMDIVFDGTVTPFWDNTPTGNVFLLYMPPQALFSTRSLSRVRLQISTFNNSPIFRALWYDASSLAESRLTMEHCAVHMEGCTTADQAIFIEKGGGGNPSVFRLDNINLTSDFSTPDTGILVVGSQPGSEIVNANISGYVTQIEANSTTVTIKSNNNILTTAGDGEIKEFNQPIPAVLGDPGLINQIIFDSTGISRKTSGGWEHAPLTFTPLAP